MEKSFHWPILDFTYHIFLFLFGTKSLRMQYQAKTPRSPSAPKYRYCIRVAAEALKLLVLILGRLDVPTSLLFLADWFHLQEGEELVIPPPTYNQYQRASTPAHQHQHQHI
jgi:hypothetical protein